VGKPRIWSAHRDRCYEDVLRFGELLRLMRDALVHHGGSAHQLFIELERDDREPVDESNFYPKLSKTPVAVGRALLSQCTARLMELLPSSSSSSSSSSLSPLPSLPSLPSCFDEYELIVGDGKKIKNAAKRLAPTRGYAGKLIGAKALVGMDLRSGMALAMSDSLDGLTNDVPLVPALMQQLRQLIPTRPILSVWDRQFDDLPTLRHLSSPDADAFLVRLKQQDYRFEIESSVSTRDAQGRAVIDEIGVLSSGRGKTAATMKVRCVTLVRSGSGSGSGSGSEDEDDVVLLSNLLDRGSFSAADLLELYRRRWGIEQLFQLKAVPAESCSS